MVFPLYRRPVFPRSLCDASVILAAIHTFPPRAVSTNLTQPISQSHAITSRPQRFSRRWVKPALICAPVFACVIQATTGLSQNSAADAYAQRFQQQQAAMERTARQMQERARQTALENERRNREMRERQEALMREQREQAAQNLARQREANERALERQRQMNQVGQDVGDVIRQGQEKSQQRLEEYRQRQELNRQKRDDALAEMSSTESGATQSFSPSSGQDIASVSNSGSVNAELNGEKFSQTRTRVITDEEASGMSFAKLRYAINEVYARHGADFDSKPELRNQFNQFDWYRPRTGVSIDAIEEDLSSVERGNIETLAKYRDLKKGH